MRFTKEMEATLEPLTKMKRGPIKTVAMAQLANKWNVSYAQVMSKVSQMKSMKKRMVAAVTSQETSIDDIVIDRKNRIIKGKIPKGSFVKFGTNGNEFSVRY